jgi:putative Holliday junction resolvase
MAKGARVLAVDLGERRVGLALSDETGLLAVPKPPIELAADAGERAVVRAVRAAVVQHGALGVVVGWPINMNGTRGPMAERAERFVEALRLKVSCPVELFDERLSTREAERRLVNRGVRQEERRRRVDGEAAAVVLEAYLARARTSSTHEKRSDEMSDKNPPIPINDEDTDEIITLTDEDGADHEFVLVDVLELNEREYAILLPFEGEDAAGGEEEGEEMEAVILGNMALKGS